METKPTADNSSRNITIPELHLTDIILFFKRNFILLFLGAGIAGILGLFYSYTKEKTYTATTTLLSEYSSARPSFFSLAMGGAASETAGPLTPELYPSILKTTSFGEHLLTLPILGSNGKKYGTIREYLTRPSEPSFVSKLMGLSKEETKVETLTKPSLQLSNKSILHLSAQEEGLINTAKGLVSVTVEQKSNLILIESEMTDPVAAAQIVEYTKDYLVNYIEDFRVGKLLKQQEFLSTTAVEAKKRQQSAEYALQSYRDHNRNSFLNVARIEEQRLQSEYTLAQSIYSDLVSKLEQMKIKVKEERPVFNVLEPSKVPLNKTSPRRLFIAGIFAALGFFIALIYSLFVKEKVQQYLFY